MDWKCQEHKMYGLRKANRILSDKILAIFEKGKQDVQDHFKIRYFLDMIKSNDTEIIRLHQELNANGTYKQK